jgi:hypothetical protein
LKAENKINIYPISRTIKKTVGVFGLVWIFFIFPSMLVYCDKLLLFKTMNNWSNVGTDVRILDAVCLFIFSMIPKLFEYPAYFVFWPMLLISFWLLFSKQYRWIADGIIILAFLGFFAGSISLICLKYCDSISFHFDISGKNNLQITLRDGKNQPLSFLEVYVASVSDPWNGKTQKADLRGKALFGLIEGEYLIMLGEKSKHDFPKYQSMYKTIFIKEGKNIEQIINMN